MPKKCILIRLRWLFKRYSQMWDEVEKSRVFGSQLDLAYAESTSPRLKVIREIFQFGRTIKTSTELEVAR